MSAVHGWFELTYAQYLTIPRSVLQSMPSEWQAGFVALLEELDERIDWRPRGTLQYRVALHQTNPDAGEDEDFWGPEVDDPLQDYERGRRRIPLKVPEVRNLERELQYARAYARLVERHWDEFREVLEEVMKLCDEGDGDRATLLGRAFLSNPLELNLKSVRTLVGYELAESVAARFRGGPKVPESGPESTLEPTPGDGRSTGGSTNAL